MKTKICVIGGGRWGINHIKTLNMLGALGGQNSCSGRFWTHSCWNVEKTEADSNKLREIIKFSPKTDIKIGISKFVDWYIEYSKQ